MRDDVLRLARRPAGVRIVPGTLAEYAAADAAAREEAVRAEAFAAGVAEAQRTSAAALDAAVDHIEALRAELGDSLAERAAGLAVEMLQELLRVELVAKNYDIVSVVRSTIREAGNSPGALALHVHPEDAARLADQPFRTGTTIVADAAVRRGDVQLHTDQGLLVRDMDACVASIKERILAEVRSC